MINPIRIESKDVPKHAYKVYKVHVGLSNKELKTYFRNIIHIKNKFNKSFENKKSFETIKHNPHSLHLGRISVFVNKINAINFCEHRNRLVSHSAYQVQVWKVEIKQTTKYAYKGKFIGDALAVDRVKPIKRVF